MLINREMIQIAKDDIDKILIVVFLQFLLNLSGIGVFLSISSSINSIFNETDFKVQIYIFFLLVFLSLYISNIIVDFEVSCDSNIKERLRTEGLKKLSNSSLENINHQRTGDISMALVLRVDAIARYCSVYLPIIMSTIITSLIVMLVLGQIDIKVSFIFLIGFLGIIITPKLWYERMKEKNSAILIEMSKYKSDY